MRMQSVETRALDAGKCKKFKQYKSISWEFLRRVTSERGLAMQSGIINFFWVRANFATLSHNLGLEEDLFLLPVMK